VEGELQLTEELFKTAKTVYLPLVGQVTQPGRAFFVSANGVEVKSVYNTDEIAILVAWHDMGKDVEKSNAPDLVAPVFDLNSTEYVKEEPSQFSDAVAIQIPSKPVDGVKKPYFIFGDSSKAVDLWFADLAEKTDKATSYVANGAKQMQKSTDDVSFSANYNEGRWTAMFKRSRTKDGGVGFTEKEFTPMAFSVWDGFNNERGNKRALTEWFHVYLKPQKEASVVGKVLLSAFICLIIELLLVYLIRRKNTGA